ncbi:MAG TPA: hypothetical protein VM715_10530 [Candidatus Acidoferrum sp.]|jgi:hypothetical protein|nr:hypothetical protein [Candidatus Acidoferrum sp.]
MVLSNSTADALGALFLIGIATWWVIAPKTCVACIRKVPWLWMSAYPMNAKEWFPRYLRLLGLFFWMLMFVGFYCYRSRLH